MNDNKLFFCCWINEYPRRRIKVDTWEVTMYYVLKIALVDQLNRSVSPQSMNWYIYTHLGYIKIDPDLSNHARLGPLYYMLVITVVSHLIISRTCLQQIWQKLFTFKNTWVDTKYTMHRNVCTWVRETHVVNGSLFYSWPWVLYVPSTLQVRVCSLTIIKGVQCCWNEWDNE